MLKTLAIIGVVVVVVIAGILLYAATKPDSFRVQRTVLINAPSDKVFPLINDLQGVDRVVALREEGSGDEAHVTVLSLLAKAPPMPGRATRMSARAAWRSSRAARARS